MAVDKISNETIEKIKQQSVLSLPNRPGENGISAKEVKKAITSPILGTNISLIEEINRIVEELEEDRVILEGIVSENSTDIDTIQASIEDIYSELDNKADSTHTHSNYVTSTTLASYSTTTEVGEKISDSLEAYYTSSEVFTKSEVESLIDAIDINDFDLSAYETKANASATYATKSYVSELTSGKKNTYVVDTEADLESVFEPYIPYEGSSSYYIRKVGSSTGLKEGDNVLIKQLNVPDYWVSASFLPIANYTSGNVPQVKEFLSILETNKVDLTPYSTTNEMNSAISLAINNLNLNTTYLKITDKFSGSYNDLTNKPTIPTIDSTTSDTSTNGIQNKVIKAYVDSKIDSINTTLGVLNESLENALS